VLCPVIIIWLDPWRWEWPQLLFLVCSVGCRVQRAPHPHLHGHIVSSGCAAVSSALCAKKAVPPRRDVALLQVAGNVSAFCYIWFAGGVLTIVYFLLQTGFGYFRVYAMFNGLIGSKKAGTWKVTKKFGAAGLAGRSYHKPYLLESLLAALFTAYTAAGVWHGAYVLSAFSCVLGGTFLMLSFGEYLL
jgi:hypothetical protein